MSLLSVNLAIINLEGALFGIFFALSIASMSLLVNRGLKEAGGSNMSVLMRWRSVARDLCQSTLFISSIIFFLVVTTHWSIGVRRTFDAFINHDGGREPAAYLGDLALPLQLARMALAELSMLLGDLILTYRTWIICGRKSWIPFPPLLTSCVFIATGIIVLYKFSLDSPTDNVYANNTGGWIIGFFVSTLLTRAYNTFLICHRIYTARQSLKGTNVEIRGRSAADILMMLVESAAFSTAWTLIFAISNLAKSTLQLLAISCSPAFNGSVFMLIIVRVGLGWDLRLYTGHGEDSIQTAIFSPSHAHPIRSIQLQVSRTTEQEVDYIIHTESSYKRPDSIVSDSP